MILEDANIYLREAGRLRKAEPEIIPLKDLAIFFLAWRRSLRAHAGALKDETPWITFAASRFLDRILSRRMRVFEYGAGGSTLFFCKRAESVISVEHDPSWREKVLERVRSRGHENLELCLVKPVHDKASVGKDPSDPGSYVSSADTFAEYSFRDYASSIDAHQDDTFDLILIDGRARPSCFLHSLPKVKPGGYIVWDNTERKHYYRAMRCAPDRFRFLDFPGPSPYVRFFTRTSAWQRLG
jgi:hypothetical protein